MIQTAAKLAIVPSLLASVCCAIPIFLYLFGSSTPPAELGQLGKVLYYDYGWYFRGFGLVVLTGISVWYWRTRGITTWVLLKQQYKQVSGLAATSLVWFVVFYVLSIAASQYIGEWLGIYEIWLTK
jgi:hypothetical protein